MSAVTAVDDQHVVSRLLRRAAQRFRPPLGWSVFAVTLLLTVLPSLAIREARWLDLRRIQVVLEWVPVISLLAGWWLVNLLRGWSARRLSESPQPPNRSHRAASQRFRVRLGSTLFLLGCLAGFLLWTALGIATVSQVLVHWIPGPIDMWRAVAASDPLSLATGARADLSALVWRYSDWLQGVQSGGAYQDDFVFLSFFGVMLWLLGGATALLVHSTRNGLIVGAPVLWVLATLLFYGRQGRQLILVGMVATLLLHVLLDQKRLERIWVGRETDFSPMLITDRLLSIFAVAVPMVLLAGFMPNVVIRPVAYKVYQTMTPVYDSVDDVTERMFPDLKGGRRGMGRLSGGLPNRFLLEGGSELGQFEVMRVSTNYPFGPVTELGQTPPASICDGAHLPTTTGAVGATPVTKETPRSRQIALGARKKSGRAGWRLYRESDLPRRPQSCPLPANLPNSSWTTNWNGVHRTTWSPSGPALARSTASTLFPTCRRCQPTYCALCPRGTRRPCRSKPSSAYICTSPKALRRAHGGLPNSWPPERRDHSKSPKQSKLICAE